MSGKRKEDMSDSDRPLAWRLRSIVGEENVLVDEPMSEHTTFEVGGPADLFVTPEDIDEVREVVSAVRESGENYFLLGRGSDLLVSERDHRRRISTTIMLPFKVVSTCFKVELNQF